MRLVGELAIRPGLDEGRVSGHHIDLLDHQHGPFGHVYPHLALLGGVQPDEARASVTEVGADVYGNNQHGTIIVETDGETCRATVERVASTRAPPAAAAPIVEDTPEDCIDINLATLAQRREVIHIDEERAGQVIGLRQQQPFASVNQLTRVRGIAAARIRDSEQQGLACVN